MNKFTIFTVILSVVIVVTVAQMLVNNYFGAVLDTHETQANVFSGMDPAQPGTLDMGILPSSDQTLGNPDVMPDIGLPGETFPLSTVVTPDDFDPTQSVTQQDLEKAGFLGLNLKIVPFDGNLFQVIDLSDLKSDRFVQYNIEDSVNVYGVIVAAWFYQDLSAAEQYYELIKSRSGKIAGLDVNETNTFGMTSFYVNDAKRVGTAFLVVRIDNRVYAVSYPKASHDFYKQLIGSLAIR